MQPHLLPFKKSQSEATASHHLTCLYLTCLSYLTCFSYLNTCLSYFTCLPYLTYLTCLYQGPNQMCLEGGGGRKAESSVHPTLRVLYTPRARCLQKACPGTHVTFTHLHTDTVA
jgi:hypothetical protein